jgi:anti-anti-sigma regulatory factor
VLQRREPDRRRVDRSGIRVVEEGAAEASAGGESFAVDSGISGPGPGPHSCEIREARRGETLVLRVHGALDWSSAPAFVDHVLTDCDAVGLVVDLTAATVDSAGTGAILSVAAADHERHRELVVVVGDGPEAQVLLDGRFDELAGLAASEPSALAWLRDRGVDTGSVGRSTDRRVGA